MKWSDAELPSLFCLLFILIYSEAISYVPYIQKIPPISDLNFVIKKYPDFWVESKIISICVLLIPAVFLMRYTISLQDGVVI